MSPALRGRRALNETTVSALRILQREFIQTLSLMELVAEWRGRRTPERGTRSLIFQQKLPAIFIKEGIYVDNRGLEWDNRVTEDNVFNVVQGSAVARAAAWSERSHAVQEQLIVIIYYY